MVALSETFKNFGVGGYGTLNSRNTFEWALNEFRKKPILVIFIGSFFFKLIIHSNRSSDHIH